MRKIKTIKKAFICFIIVFLITGCTDQTTLNNQIKKAVNRAITCQFDEDTTNNCQKKYYSYYLRRNVGRVSADEISNIFKISGNIASLSLDITSIVNNSILLDSDESTIRDIGTLENPIYSDLSRFTDSSGQSIPYKLAVAKMEDNDYFVMIQTSHFIFIASNTADTCADTIYDMILLLRSCKVDKEDLILDYASDNIITYSTSVVTLFEDVVPESGYLIDYIDSWKNDTSFVVIDNRPQEETVIDTNTNTDSDIDIQQDEDNQANQTEQEEDYGKVDR